MGITIVRSTSVASDMAIGSYSCLTEYSTKGYMVPGLLGLFVIVFLGGPLAVVGYKSMLTK